MPAHTVPLAILDARAGQPGDGGGTLAEVVVRVEEYPTITVRVEIDPHRDFGLLALVDRQHDRYSSEVVELSGRRCAIPSHGIRVTRGPGYAEAAGNTGLPTACPCMLTSMHGLPPGELPPTALHDPRRPARGIAGHRRLVIWLGP